MERGTTGREQIVYISGALTGLEDHEEQKGFYEDIASICEELGFQVYLPHKHTDPVKHPYVTPQEVFKTDKMAVRKADLVIAYVGKPSLGVGMELAYAEVFDIPVILLLEEDKRVSRFALGAPNVKAVIRFRTREEGLKKLRSTLKYKLITSLTRSPVQ